MYTIVIEGIEDKEAADLGSAADEIYELVNLRREIAKKDKQITGRMTYLKHYLLENMPDDGLTGVCGKKALVSSIIKEIPTVSDWPTFYAYILENNRMDLLQKRLSTRSCGEVFAEGDNIPGVEIREILDLKIGKNK